MKTRWSGIAAAVLLGFGWAASAWPARQDVNDAPANPPASARIAPAGEPGAPLVISGTVYAEDGTTPLPDIVVYAYQTDVTGFYRPDHLMEPPRLRGWARSDAAGHYEFRTIRPAAYPERTIPAHVHFHVWGKGYPRQFVEDLQFRDDPFMTATLLTKSSALGRFANICAPQKDPDGAQRCCDGYGSGGWR